MHAKEIKSWNLKSPEKILKRSKQELVKNILKLQKTLKVSSNT